MAIPAVSDVSTLLTPCVPLVILRLPIISSLATGAVVPMPTFCPCNSVGRKKVQLRATIRIKFLDIVIGLSRKKQEQA